MNVLSLFDGISCGQIALQRAGVPVSQYFASEIDKYAIKVTQHNYPNTIQLGDVRNITAAGLPHIDLLIGGSPCQGFSFAGKGLNFEDPRSKLFFEYVRLLKELKPRYFLLENVVMKKEWIAIISEQLRCEPVRINSGLVSAQNRVRLYWSNIPNITQPADRGIMLKDITEDGANKAGASRARYVDSFEKSTKQNIELRKDNKSNSLTTVQKNNVIILDSHKSKSGLICVAGLNKNKKWLDNGKELQRNFSQGERIYHTDGKSPTLSAHSGGTAGVGNALITSKPIFLGGIKEGRRLDDGKTLAENFSIGYRVWDKEGKFPTVRTADAGLIEDEGFYRKLTITEAERLQTLPDGYTSPISKSQGFKCIGNGWTVDVVAWIFSFIKV